MMTLDQNKQAFLASSIKVSLTQGKRDTALKRLKKRHRQRVGISSETFHVSSRQKNNTTILFVAAQE